MEFKTPTKAVARVQLKPSSKKLFVVICSIQIKNTNFRLRLFHKDTKSSHCVLIEKLLQVEIINSASYADNVCRNRIRKVQSTLVISTSVISNNRLSRRENLVLVLT